MEFEFECILILIIFTLEMLIDKFFLNVEVKFYLFLLIKLIYFKVVMIFICLVIKCCDFVFIF